MSSSPARYAAAEPSHAHRFAAWTVRVFHAYANWLVGISWKRFIVLSILLMIIAGVLTNIPPFTWHVSETIETLPPKPPKPPVPVKPKKPVSYGVTIDDKGIRIFPAGEASSGAAASAPASIADVPSAVASAASAAASAVEAAHGSSGPSITLGLPVITIDLSKSAKSKEIREAVEDARRSIEDAVNDAREAAADAEQARADAMEDVPHTRIRRVELGQPLPPLAFAFIIASMILKITYKGRLQAEVKAAQATETAEAESLKRQVVEARMAAMQAQVEPHFLFNTLASIDHLIETDPARASKMQKNLIALLRASMPTLREADTNLGRELAVIRPYLEILKVRMEERLQTEIRVSEGLLSAEFPPMMLQSLVENAIKHGLEPKADGGMLVVSAEIVDGDLVVSVADTGLGFGKAATAGTGLGLANIRERLALLYGPRARLEVAENPGGGTRVSITVPYRSKARNADASA